MDQKMKMSLRVPIFEGDYYVFYKIRMKIYLISIGLYVWALVEEGYDVPKFTPCDIPILPIKKCIICFFKYNKFHMSFGYNLH